MSDHEHEWYVKGSYESTIDLKSKNLKSSWADLNLECINYDDTNCEKEASVFVDIDINKIIEVDN